MCCRVKWGWICAAAWLVCGAVLPAADDEAAPPIAAADSLDVDALARKAEAVIQVVDSPQRRGEQ